MFKKPEKKILYLIAIIFLLLTSIILFFPKPKAKQKKKENMKISFASENIDPEKVWRSYFEDKLSENRDISSDELLNLKESYRKDFERIASNNSKNISDVRSDFQIAHQHLKQKIDELILLQQKNFEEVEKDTYKPQISILNMDDGNEILNLPIDRMSYIAETSYVTGVLMGGIAVSTSIGSASAPIPVAIRIIDRGNFPDNFKLDLKLCRILGSAYGDLSSERAVIRAEMLICENGNEIISTKISGIIYGDDGMNGIKGRVIDMSSKHIKNAAMGGILSAFSGTMKNEADMKLSSFGFIHQKSRKTTENIRENSLKGGANAAEKIADYYIKKAENMSPILQIPGGTKLDIIFTKGTYLGTSDVVSKINSEKR